MNPTPETPPDLGSVSSIALIVHGVGKATSNKLLTAAAKGYRALGLEGNAKRARLSECPALCGNDGAEGLMIEGVARCDLVVALPWSDRRTRMSSVAQASAVMILILAIVATLSFLIRGPLDAAVHWLGIWSHRLLSYFAIVVIGWLVHVAGPNSEGEYRPPLSLLWLPLIFELTLLLFSDPTLLWILISLPVVILWLMCAVTIVRSIRVAPALRWRLALWVLIVAISFPTAALIRAVKQSADRAEAASFEIIPLPAYLPDTHLFKDDADIVRKTDAARDSLTSNPEPGVDQKSKKKSTAKKAIGSERAAKPNQAARPKELIRSTPDLNLDDDLFPLMQPQFSQADIKALLAKKPGISDLITTSDFKAALAVSALGVVLVLLATSFSWLLDFGFDVLYFAGQEKQRLALIEATAKAIRWFHEQAPNARLILVGHSLGSVLAAQTLSLFPSSEPCLRNITLVTLGSPLNYLSKVFPESVRSVRQLSTILCPQVPWVNLWRSRDVIGKALDTESENTVQYCAGRGGHPDYWSDGNVWRAVTREVFTRSNPDGRNSSGRDLCILERHLGKLTLGATMVLYLLGAGLWIMAR